MEQNNTDKVIYPLPIINKKLNRISHSKSPSYRANLGVLNKIREYLSQSGLTITQVAESHNVGWCMLYRVLTGDYIPKTKFTQQKFAVIFSNYGVKLPAELIWIKIEEEKNDTTN